MRKLQEVTVYAHRGASKYALENTWNAFYKACEFNVGIELDVQITKDGVVVVFHDDNLKRLGGKKYKIENILYEELKELKIGKRWSRRFSNAQIPLAYEVFQWAKEKQVPLNIEMKNSFSAHPEGPKILASMLEGLENFHVSSFNPHLLKEMKQLMPAREMALIIKKSIPLEAIRKMKWIDSIHLHRRLYSLSFLEALQEMKKNIRIYNIIGSEAAMKKIAPELKGIITDYPERITKKLRLPVKR
ncbi:glycerophosphodiester phosphodiesterase [Planococcus shenhongbingii]|uniref:Glycerophosphodiester phosphodiesterase family protein n=1 Tax=Planococcus shenhongbingii TaxID=3058398 RepID=A0ABT8NCW0_9BACL|nr:glycerophosphodiester phosphodiesterase family protein [Planococcus sp. N017]MDN7245725.1 glycerophosphodiester phosphodiesterase family protein [Planococcus sp. N017]